MVLHKVNNDFHNGFKHDFFYFDNSYLACAIK